MPTYEYACKSCLQHLEVVQSFNDAALTECPACGGPLRKVFQPIGIAFKGSGFYKNDSRSSSSSKGTDGKSADTSASSAPSSDAKASSSDAKASSSEPKPGTSTTSSDKSSSAAAS